MNRKHLIFFLLAFSLICCRKPYNPPAIKAPNSYLVVEGVINSGSDSTIITLSRTVNLNSQTTINPVTGASVFVESDQNGKWPLTPDGTGRYIATALDLLVGPNYRIHIITSDNKQYISDYQQIKPTPPIDSLGYAVTGNAINIYVNTHDPANNTHYYMWEYNEAWLFHARYQSSFIGDYATETVLPRTPAQQVYTCYGSDISTNIILSSTAKLSKDEVFQSPLTGISFNSEKLERQYEIYVKQYALTAAAYNFYQNLKNNTENLGSIFDAQPSELKGNIHNMANASEPVIGWISVTNVQTKLLTVTAQVVPQGTVVNYPADCQADTVLNNTSGLNGVENILIDPPHTDEAIDAIYNKMGMIIGYSYSSNICTDCTLRGRKQAPWYWK